MLWQDNPRIVLFYFTQIRQQEQQMQVNDKVSVKTDGGPRRTGSVLAVESFSEGVMFLVALDDYPRGVWFFNENSSPDGIFVEPWQEDPDQATG